MVLPSRLFVLCLSLLLAACASEPRVRSDYDPQADFSRYQTFAFFSPAGTDKAGYGTLVTERLKHPPGPSWSGAATSTGKPLPICW